MIPEHAAAQAIALAEQGANVSQIARHLGHDRKTIRVCLDGQRAPGQRRQHADAYAPFAAYISRRADDDPHLRGAGVHREITALGYAGSYPALTRELRERGISSGCPACSLRRHASGTAQQRPAPPLPVRVAPVTGETVASYLSAVAAACHLPARAITAVLPQWFAVRAAACDDLAGPGLPQPGGTAILAALTGISQTALRRALPALAASGRSSRPPVRATTACRRCAALAGRDGPVPVHLPAHQKACARHQIWIGRTAQIGLTAAPGIIRACQRASRLASQHGVTALVLAETTARQQAGDTAGPSTPARQRATALASYSPRLDPEDPDIADAACYPEIIAIAAVMLRSGARPGGPD